MINTLPVVSRLLSVVTPRMNNGGTRVVLRGSCGARIAGDARRTPHPRLDKLVSEDCLIYWRDVSVEDQDFSVEDQDVSVGDPDVSIEE